MPKMTGSKFIADTVHGYGITHVFFMPYIAPRALMEMEKLGVNDHHQRWWLGLLHLEGAGTEVVEWD